VKTYIIKNTKYGELQYWLVGWLFNGKSTQKGQFVPTEGGGKLA